MQSEAFRYNKSFEHSPKPSKHPNYMVFNDSMSTNVKIEKMSKITFDRCYNTEQKYAESNGAVHFA